MKLPRIPALLLGLSAAAFLGAFPGHAQVLNNTSFEADLLGATTANSWTAGAATSLLIVNGQGVTAGSQALQLTIANDGNYTGRLEQFRSESNLLAAGFVSGQQYVFSGDLFISQLGSGTSLRPGIFLDNGGSLFGVNFDSTTTSFAFSFIYNGGFAIFKPIEGGAYGTDFIARLDNLQVTPIPEPASAVALIGIAAAGFAGSRRSRRRVTA